MPMHITLVVKTIIIEVIFMIKVIGNGVGSIIELTLCRHPVSTRMTRMGACLDKIFDKILICGLLFHHPRRKGIWEIVNIRLITDYMSVSTPNLVRSKGECLPHVHDGYGSFFEVFQQCMCHEFLASYPGLHS